MGLARRWLIEMCCHLPDDVLDEITEDVDMRKRLRPLLDVVQDLARHRK